MSARLNVVNAAATRSRKPSQLPVTGSLQEAHPPHLAGHYAAVPVNPASPEPDPKVGPCGRPKNTDVFDIGNRIKTRTDLTG